MYFVSSVAFQGEMEIFQDSLVDMEVVAQVVAYLRRLGFQDEQGIQALAYGCVKEAGKSITGGKINQRALKETWKCLDKALSRCLNLDPYADRLEVARARAAFLLGKGVPCMEDLFREDNVALQAGKALQASLPQAVPPEAPLPMPEQAFG